MTRAGLLLTALLAAAWVGVLAQDSSRSASAPPQVSNQTVAGQNPAPQPGAAPTSAPVSPAASQQAAPGSAQPANSARGNASASDAQGISDDGTSTQRLPQTSTILPLLGLIGLGSLVAGLFARR
jgi:hypothetical protein